ncbi:type VI secretion system ImpA family N-terminal domain-containing protein [Celerinatantimonas diazotrophica]|nr:type VI secretion system ImpA family N-terminal domain-containing protein [Celerinatantimonas diazotrophica]
MNRFKIVDDERQLRDNELYQQIRSEVNRRFNPLSGGCDWQKIYNDCQSLIRSSGSDLLLASYYCVASLKVEGISGLADALELEYEVLDKFGEQSIFPAQRRLELFNWQTSLVIPELKRLNPNLEQLRELYRCERACQALDEQIQQLQQEQIQGWDALGLSIFEQIDKLERAFNAPSERVKVVNKATWGMRLRWAIVGGVLAIVVGTPMALKNHAEQLSPLWTALSSQQIEPKALTLKQGQDIAQRFSHTELHANQDEFKALYYQRIQQLNQRPVYWRNHQVNALIDTLSRLYPNDSQVEKLKKHYTHLNQHDLSLYRQQLDKFRQARTDFANLEQAFAKHNYWQAQRLAKTLSGYSQSLSPVYGQMAYIEKLLEGAHVRQAREQLEQLNQRIKAIHSQMDQLASHIPSHS